MPYGTPRPGDISDLVKNRALLEWLRWQVGLTERRIRELEIQEAQEQARRPAAMSCHVVALFEFCWPAPAAHRDHPLKAHTE